MKSKLIFILILYIPCVFLFAASNPCFDIWEEFSRTPGKDSLAGWMKETAHNILFNRKSFTVPDISMHANPDCTGFFVTLIRKGKVRGCYGAFSHSSGSLTEILKEYINGALFLDPRYKPLERYELDDTEIILTITSNPEPVDNINNVDISNFGVFIDCDDSTKNVIVPAEYRTISRIIKFTGNPRCRFYRFRAVTIR